MIADGVDTIREDNDIAPVVILPLHTVSRTWKRGVFPAFHHLRSALCVCPRKVAVLADGGKGE